MKKKRFQHATLFTNKHTYLQIQKPTLLKQKINLHNQLSNYCFRFFVKPLKI